VRHAPNVCGESSGNGAVHDDGNDDARSNVGILVTWDLTNGAGGAEHGRRVPGETTSQLG
jgi:hypothetical protein